MKIAIEIELTNEISHLLPVWALHDINKRITDWLAGGGKVLKITTSNSNSDLRRMF